MGCRNGIRDGTTLSFWGGGGEGEVNFRSRRFTRWPFGGPWDVSFGWALKANRRAGIRQGTGAGGGRRIRNGSSSAWRICWWRRLGNPREVEFSDWVIGDGFIARILMGVGRSGREGEAEVADSQRGG